MGAHGSMAKKTTPAESSLIPEQTGLYITPEQEALLHCFDESRIPQNHKHAPAPASGNKLSAENATENTGVAGFARTPAKAKPHYSGHRQRLRERFSRHGSEVMADYELLELLLFRTIARADTKPLAKALLNRFGSFAAVLGAETTLLREVPGCGEAVAQDIKLLSACAQRLGKSEIMKKNVLDSWNKVIAYCMTSMAYENREQFRILFLDKKNRLIADEVQQIGTVDHTPVYPREVIKRALELSSTALILFHNHPSGDATPSRADVDMTKLIISIAAPLNITVHDHIIIGKGGHISMRGMGLI